MSTANRPHPGVPIAALMVEITGTLLMALGVLAVFSPAVLTGLLPDALHAAVTPLVGWTAVAVGAPTSTLGAWQLVSGLRRQRCAPGSP